MSRQRRSSSFVSELNLGDTTAPALSTMRVTSAQREASRSRRKTLSLRRSSRTKTFWAWYRETMYRHTWVNPLVFMLVIITGYLVNPRDSNPLKACIFLSYPVPASETKSGVLEYSKGKKDLLFVLFYTAFFSFTREFIMQRLLRPLAIKCGINKKGKIARFMEQSYTALYCSVFGLYGLYVMYHTPIWYFNTKAFWEGYPHHTHVAIFKAYYLLQASFWTQQAIVLMLQLEKPRKDFKELVMHHIVTLSLIALSYRFHFTYIGLAVYITHDVSDFFLATSKTFNYLDVSFIGPYFALFTVSWIYCRHYINILILKSVLFEMRTVGEWGNIDWSRGFFKCPLAQNITFGLLASLQALNLFWLYLIFKVARRYVWPKQGEKFEDVRSDEEDEGEGDTGTEG
ncbi:TLC domain-containing protein [Kalaharituber pfeilii]|nr:TLC domain-containing protein [Kalaharituber pfeilii]